MAAGAVPEPAREPVAGDDEGASEKSLERQIRAFHWIRLLSELTGRQAGSDQEGEAARRVEFWLRDLGLDEVSISTVPSRPRTGLVWSVHAGVAALGCVFGGWIGFALVALAWHSFRREASGGEPLLSRWLPARDSQNVVARVGAERPRRRVVLLSSLDAGQPSALFSGRLRRWLASPGADGVVRGDAALPARLLGATCIVAGAAALGADAALVGLARFALGAALAGLAVAGFAWARTRSSGGANDNGSGVAAMLSAVEQLAAQLPPDAELWCAATGSGQAGAAGTKALLDAHPEWDDGRTAVVVLEGVGEGVLHYARSEGSLVRVAHSPKLCELARRIAAGGAYGAALPVDLPFTTSGAVAARRGLPVLTMTALQRDGLPRAWRAPGDTVGDLDAETVVRAADFGCCVLSAYLRGDAEPLAYV